MTKLSVESALLNKERNRTNFSVEELTNLYDGGPHETKIRRDCEKLVYENPIMSVKNVAMMTRDERFVNALKRTLYFQKNIAVKMGLHPGSPEIKHLQRVLGKDITLVIHTGVFIPSLMSFGSDEQVAKWLPLAAQLHIIGTYAQTEMGHGTFLRGLETTATYDRQSQEFVINCPKISSMKWWPGDMGKSANHVMLMAQLVVNDKKLGMHPFIVQIRDLSTHMPLKGVDVGDIGNKLAFETVDNGFLYLKNVRIPRKNLLCKNAEVLPDGTYVKKASDRMVYGSMVRLRVSLLDTQALVPLAQAVTIAVRYSTVRRQGSLQSNISGSPETPVMDYVTQQHKLLPLVATAYVVKFAGSYLLRIYQESIKKFETGDTTSLPELHALSAGMKASVTEQCCSGIEIARKACGGHGFSDASGIPFILRSAMASQTYEGENTVMYLQCARFLTKFANGNTKNLTGSVQYLSMADQKLFQNKTIKNLMDLNFLSLCFQQRSRSMIKSATANMEKLIQNGTPKHQAWNLSTVRMVDAAKAHIDQYIVSSYFTFLNDLESSLVVKQILTQLGVLYAIHSINQNPGDYIKNGCLNAEQCELCQDAEVELLTNLRGNCVGLVDAFDFSDESLNSCLGAFDGDVYNRLYDWAKSAPFNKTEVHGKSYALVRPYLLAGRDSLEGKSKL